MINKTSSSFVSSTLQVAAIATIWCSSALAVAETFPQAYLLTQITSSAPLPPVPGSLQRSLVQWHTENLGDLALKVRHIIVPTPALKLEVVFDGELRTFALARSWHGHVSDDPGAQVTLTHYQSRLLLTIDSPKYGVIAVRDSNLNPVDDTIQGIASIRDIDHVPFVKDDPNSYKEMVEIFRDKTAAMVVQVAALSATGHALVEEQVKLGSAVTAARAEVEAAQRGRDDAAVAAAQQKLRLAQVAAEQSAQSVATNVAEGVAAQRQLDVARAAEVDMNLIQTEAARRRGEWDTRTTGAARAAQWKPFSAARGAAPLASVTHKVAAKAASQQTVKADAFGFSATCADPVGEIDVAVVVSSRVWDLAFNSAIAEGSKTKSAVAIDSVTVEVTHALDTANTALKRSAVSHPAFDIGFRLVGLNPNATVIPDGLGSNEPLDEWHNFHDGSNSAHRTAVKAAAQSGLFVNSSQPDMILSVIVGDADIGVMRGVATIGDPDVQLSTDAPYAVVKLAALNAPETHAMAHELGHILGAGHDPVSAGSGDSSSTAGFKSWARGQVNMNSSSTNSNLNVVNRETLMGLSECALSQNGTNAYSCRRVPFYSNQQVLYPYYGGIALGEATKDNAAIMRQTRNMMARANCSNPAPAGLWLKKNAAQLPNTLSAVSAVSEPLPWEAQSLWRRNAASPGGSTPPTTYQHQSQSVPTGTLSSFFVNVFSHNSGMTTSNGVLGLWRATKPLAGGRWLSPLFSDFERLDGSASKSWCSNPIHTYKTDANGNTIAVTGVAPGAWGLEIGCIGVPFKTTDDPLFVRWVPADPQASNVANAQLVDMTTASAASLWRSVTIIPLALGDVSEVQTVVLRKSSMFPRTVQLSVKPAPGQGNFYSGMSGVNTLEIETAALSILPPPCVNADNSACTVLGVGTNPPTTKFQIKSIGADLNLLLPKKLNTTSAEVPVKLIFARAPNAQDVNLPCPLVPCVNFPSPDLPPTDVLIRVIEFESGKVRGGASFVVQAKRQ